MAKNLKIWRESASLIIAAKTIFSTSKHYNYKILTLQRSSKTGFFPGTYVFPGGNMSKSDCNMEWLKLYELFGFNLSSFEDLQPKENVPSILLNNNDHDTLPKYLSLRICAIRETFEECGILICKSKNLNHTSNSNWASYIGGSEILKWQDKIHNDAKEFLNLCSEMEIYPDVWALKIWNNWITPPSLIEGRFNAMFFISTFHQMPDTHLEEKEIQELKWAPPDALTKENIDGNMMVPPPQFYEISRLKNFTNIDELTRYMTERSPKGCEQYLPHRISTHEGLYSILPGDALYPNEIDRSNTDIPFIENMEEGGIKNRIFHEGPFRNKIITLNYTPKAGHLPPVSS